MSTATNREDTAPGSEEASQAKKHTFVALSSHEKVPLRIYIARESLRSVLRACAVSLAITCAVLLIVHALFGVEFAGPVPMLVSACAVCALTLMISGHRIMRSSKQLAAPAEQFEKEASRISQGAFDVRIDETCKELNIVEVDEMVDSFNAMAAALEAMDYMQRDFTSNVSHEFKTPIAAITGMCELIADPKLPDEERNEYLDLMHEQAQRLSKLCDSVLAMSRLDAQGAVSHRERCDVDEQIRRDVIMLSERWADRDIALELDLDALPIVTDPNLSHQIWINLIDNAYKYTPDGGTIRLQSRTLPDGVQVRVSDTGRGMTSEEAAHAFDRFYQANRSHVEGGSGLGLSIVRRICELLGGTIGCESTPGEGTTMTVTLPRTLA